MKACFSLLLLFTAGCAMPDRFLKMKENGDAWAKQEQFQMGRVYDPESAVPFADRCRMLRWSEEAHLADLRREMQRPAHMNIDVQYEKVDRVINGQRVRDASPGDQVSLHQEWKRRIMALFRNDTFEVDEDALSLCLDGDGVRIYYFLVNRHNSPEMGHNDVVKFIVVGTGGRIIGRTKPKFSLDYPFGFCDCKKWDYNFLL